MAVNSNEDFWSIWDWYDLMCVSVSGMELTETAIRMKVGENAKVDFTMNVNSFLCKLSEEELDNIKKLITKLQLNKLKIGVHKIPITDVDGNQTGEFYSEI